MTAATPQVSFIVPAYNAADTLPATIASLAAQTVTDWEAVIVDDGSKDRTATVARAAAAADPRLRVVRQANGGASAARNRGIAEARGAFVAFLDSDDWIEPDFIETLLPLTDSGRAIGYCAYRRILPSGQASPADWCPELEQDAFAVLVQRCEPAIHCLLIPRPLLLSVGGFDATLRTCEDWDLWLRLARTGTPFRGTPRALASYRMRPFSLSTEKAGGSDAGRVLAIALGPDPRVPSPAPQYAHGWRDAPENRLAEGLATETRRLVQGLAPDPRWIVSALGQGWREIVMSDPGDVVSAIETACVKADAARADTLAATLLRGMRQCDRWVGDLVADWRDMAQARAGGVERPTRAGRWLAMPVDPAALPDRIAPPPGCDALLLISTAAITPRREIALPLSSPLSRAQIADALMEAWSLGDLARLSCAWRMPRFFASLASESLAAIGRNGLSLPDRAAARSMVSTVVRRSLARALGAGVKPMPAAAPFPGEVPVLMFDRIVPGGASLLAPDIGTRQLADLLELLDCEGYEAVGFADLVSARAGEGTMPDRPVILVFAHAASAFANGVLDTLPPRLASAEILFTPEEIEAGLPGRTVGAGAKPRLGAGLRVARMALTTTKAEGDALGWRAALARQTASDGPFAAFSDVQGLPDAILRNAGFGIVLSPGSAHARLDVSSPIVPTIECRGSEAIGDAIENLRPAA